MSVDTTAELGPGEKLHPMSWLFVLIAQLLAQWPIMLSLFAASKVSRDDGVEIILALVGAGIVTAVSLFVTLSYRFWVLEDEIVIKEGLINRTIRHVPFARIQNIPFRRTLLHRLFGVVALSLESGAGMTPEAQLTVLTLARAQRLEQQIRRAKLAMPKPAALAQNEAAAAPPAESAEETMLMHQVPLSDLVRLGLISNRGMLVIGAAYLFFMQTGYFPRKQFGALVKQFSSWIGVSHGPIFWLMSAFAVVIAMLVVIRLASIVYAIYKFYDFRLFHSDGRFRMEYGLLTRHGATLKRAQLVAFAVWDGWLHRYFGRQSVEVLTPGLQMQEGQVQARYITPVASPQQINVLLRQCADINLARVQFQPLHMGAWRRVAKWPVLIALGPTIALSTVFMQRQSSTAVGVVLALYLAFAAISIYGARRNARASGFYLDRRFFVVRSGFFSQVTMILRRNEIQSVRLTQSPFDRRAAMASVMVDLRAGSGLGPQADIHYLPENVAYTLARVLRHPDGFDDEYAPKAALAPNVALQQ